MRQSIMRQLRPLPTSRLPQPEHFSSSLFSVTDADGDFIAKYQVFDSTSDPSSGYWAINGVAQGSNVAIDVTAAQLASTTFQSGSGSDDLWSVPTTEQRGVRGRSFTSTRRSITPLLRSPPTSQPTTTRTS